MKIAAKTSMTALATVMVLALGSFSTAALAEEAAPGPSSTQVSSSVKEALDSIEVPGSSTAKAKPESVKKDSKGKADKEESVEDEDDQALGMPDVSLKIPGSVKGVVKALNDETEEVTLENLNSAREAVVKLDVLIDIEKRLNDLTKLRKEREEQMQVEEAIPQSALGGAGNVIPPPALAPAPVMNNSAAVPAAPAPMAAMAMPAEIEVKRVVGASGNFSAQVSESGGEARMVRVGDKLSDGSTIDAISSRGVSITRADKTKKTVSVKDVSVVFGVR